jgi:predicted small secreted protein
MKKIKLLSACLLGSALLAGCSTGFSVGASAKIGTNTYSGTVSNGTNGTTVTVDDGTNYGGTVTIPK